MPAARPASRCTPRRGSSKELRRVARQCIYRGCIFLRPPASPRRPMRPSVRPTCRSRLPFAPRSLRSLLRRGVLGHGLRVRERRDACRRERAGQRLLICEQSRLRTRQRKRHRAATRLGALGHGVLGLRGGEEGGAVARGRAEGGVSGRARGMTRRGRREGARRLYSPARPGAAGARPSAPRGSSASASWRSAPGARPRWPAWREGEGWRKGGREGSGGAGQRVGSAAASASAREREEALRGLASAPRRAPRRAPRCVRLLSSTHQAVERVVDERVHDRPA